MNGAIRELSQSSLRMATALPRRSFSSSLTAAMLCGPASPPPVELVAPEVDAAEFCLERLLGRSASRRESQYYSLW